MTKQMELPSKNPAPLTFDEQQAKARAAAELLKGVRRVRKQAELGNFHMIAYLLNMAEIEASDYVASTPRQCSPSIVKV
jgi:hypothetical protein